MADIEFIRCSGTNEDFIENCQLLDMDLDLSLIHISWAAFGKAVGCRREICG